MSEPVFTDVMLHVTDMAAAAIELKNTLGCVASESGEGWIGLSLPGSNQRVVLTSGDFGAPWALAMQTPDFLADVRHFENSGWSLTDTRDLTVASFALLRHSSGCYLLLYRTNK